MQQAPHAWHQTLWPLRFISLEAASGVVLLTAAILALAWANSPWAHAYEALWQLKLNVTFAGLLPVHDLRFWVNDGLMTVFFLVVGLEIRREMHEGVLSNPRIATLPVIAALGGVLVPALLYMLINTPPVLRHGWGVPTATDIAFAVGVLSLTSAGVPPAVRLLLLTLAMIDDIAAIFIIAAFYSGGVVASGFLIVAVSVLAVLIMHWLGIASPGAYVAPTIVAWYGMLRAGVHPTLAGLLLGLLTPATLVFGRRAREAPSEPSAETPLVSAESGLHPWVAFGIMPVFALANAGVSLGDVHLGGAAMRTVGAGVVLGLVLGKPIGISLASLGAVRLGFCALPDGVRWRHIGLLGLLGGIGFTMSIFIANLAFADYGLLATAKFSVLVASALAGMLGLLVGRLNRDPEGTTAEARPQR